MPKRKPKIEVSAPILTTYFRIEDHLPKDGEHKCWYCNTVLIRSGILTCNASSIQLLLSGDFACKSCQEKVSKSTPGYAKARASYNAWCNRNLERHMKYAKTHPLRITVSHG